MHGWSNYVALGDSLTAGRDDQDAEGFRIGWTRRLAGILGARTSVPCALTNLAADGAGVAAVLEEQLPTAARMGPDLVEVARQRIRQASGIIREQAALSGAICLDIWAIPGSADPDLFAPDRIHPNARGHQLMADAFAALLLEPA